MDETTVVSTRIRLARNISGLPFPHKLAQTPAMQVVDKVGKALASVDSFSRYDMGKITKLDGTVLQEKHLISPDLLNDCPFGSAFISPDETVSVMVNEEDHIREQVIMNGFSLDEAFDKINTLDDVLSRDIKFAYSPRFGYLTSCTTNVGTGMRASVMVFLPALTGLKLIENCVNGMSRLNMTVRGVYGEGSKAVGCLYQISNRHTLGVKEGDVLNAVRSAINNIIEAELRARAQLKYNETELRDDICRAWGTATNAYKLSTSEAMQLLSLKRLGGYYGYIEIKDLAEFQKIVISCQPANIQKLGGNNLEPSARDVFRAHYIAAALGEIAKKCDI